MSAPDDGVEPIAIVGLSGRLSGHWNVDSFWRAITVSGARMLSPGEQEHASDARYIDADALGLSAREAQVVAPPQRVCLECAWELFESAAYDPTRYQGRIGIYASVAADDRYLARHLHPHARLLRSFSESELAHLTSHELAPHWVSRRLNLKGPCVCLSAGECGSTAAIHLACQCLRDRECEMAIAGGVGIRQRSRDEADSREAAHEWCAGFVLLKRLSSARADRDAIRAVIHGPAGASAHVVLEEAPALTSSSSRSSHLLRISAGSLTAVETMAARLRDYLGESPDVDLADVAYSLDTGRRSFGYRKAIVCRSVTDALEYLSQDEQQKVDSGFAASSKRPVVFMFPGAGAHHPGMGRGLYEAESIFRGEFDRCCDIVASREGVDLGSAVYPDDPEATLDQPVPVLGGLFALEYSLARLWMELGVDPESMIGHSLGEYVAACLSGVFTLEDALTLVAFRGRLFETVPVGAMLSVSLSESELVPYLSNDLSLAGINAPAACVVSGSEAAVKELQEKLSSREIDTRLLHVGRAGHSKFVDPIVDEFTRFVRTLRLGRPRIPYLSNYTGTWTKEEDAMDPAYWAAHLRHTVRFAQGIDALLLGSDRVFLEVGPGRALSTLARQHPKSRERVILSSMRHVRDSQSDLEVFQRALGKLWTSGVPIDSGAVYRDERRQRISLPGYPFERKRHWVEAEEARRPASSSTDSDCVEPRNEIESAIARIWRDVLGVGTVSVEGCFRDSGGDERLLEQMKDRVTREFGVVTDERWSVKSTIAQLADLVSERALETMPEEELAKALADLDLPPV